MNHTKKLASTHKNEAILNLNLKHFLAQFEFKIKESTLSWTKFDSTHSMDIRNNKGWRKLGPTIIIILKN